jgi:predicted nucleic acid-binding protein
VAAARDAGRRAGVHDAWIAATAHAHEVAVSTQDDDFDAFGVAAVRV